MLRKLLESKVGHLSNSEFSIICGIVTDDLMFNRVNFKKCTSLTYVIDISVRCAQVVRKCA